MEKLAPFLPDLGPAWSGTRPLPGGDMPDADFDRFYGGFRAAYPFLPEKTAYRLARFYGTDAIAMLDGTARIEDLGYHFGADLYEREVRHLMEKEYARSAEDVIWRRTRLGLKLTVSEERELDRWIKVERTRMREPSGLEDQIPAAGSSDAAE
jgi:glycerol-3-phosphate dehydrogenase